jgi:diguanylate cyclase (GGDEF)-like protein
MFNEKELLDKILNIDSNQCSSSEFISEVNNVFKSYKLQDVKLNGESLVFDSQVGELIQDIVQMKHELMVMQEEVQKLEVLSSTDDVTDFFNQRRLLDDLDSLIDKNDVFNVLFLDIDHFKEVNDKFGHIIGSKLLRDISKIIRSKITSEYLYRYGGDEFVIILSKVNAQDSSDKANELLDAIKAYDFQVEGHGSYSLSVSIGICEYPTNAKIKEDIISVADKMMYRSKKEGRGKVRHIQLSDKED